MTCSEIPLNLPSSSKIAMICRYMERSLCTVLLVKAVHQVQNGEDWWIYVPVYASAAILSLINVTSSIIWRILSAVVILLGTTLIAFLIWTMHYLALVITDKPLNDKTNILLVSTAVIMISCKRLQTSHYTSILAYFRMALLFLAIVIGVSGITFSLFFNGNTSFFDIQEAILGLFN